MATSPPTQPITVWGWRPVRSARRVAHRPCVISSRASARSRVRAWGALRARERRSCGDCPQRAYSTRNTKPDHLRQRVIRWETSPPSQAPQELQLSNWTRFKWLAQEEKVLLKSNLEGES